MKVAVTVKHWRDAFPSGLLLFAVPLPSNNTFSTLTVKVCCRPKGRGAPGCWGEHGQCRRQQGVPRPAGRRMLLPSNPVSPLQGGDRTGAAPVSSSPCSAREPAAHQRQPSPAVGRPLPCGTAVQASSASHRSTQRPCAHLEEEPGFISLIAASLYSSH